MLNNLFLSLLVLTAVLISGCSTSTNPDDQLQVPTTYDSTGWTSNTTEQYLVRQKITDLLNLIKSAKTEATVLSEAEMLAIYTPIETYVNPTVTDRFRELIRLSAAASGHTYSWQADPGANGSGGVYDGRLYDAYGRDLKEFVEKGLFTSVLYYQALQLMNGTVTQATVDKIVALYGANPSFTNGSTTAADRDVFVAGYAARRDKNDGNGLYSQFKKSALKAKAAAADPSKYGTQLSEALATMRILWEKAMMATAINYAYSTIGALTSTNLTDSSRSAGMHTYGECAGIVDGYQSVNSSDRIASAGNIQLMLTQLMIPANQSPMCYTFWQQTQSTIQSVENFTRTVQGTYGFSDAEMTDFKSNWVSIQKR